MCGSMVDIQSPTAEIRRGKKKEEEEERKKKPQGENIMVCPIPWGGHNQLQDENIMSAAAAQGGHNYS